MKRAVAIVLIAALYLPSLPMYAAVRITPPRADLPRPLEMGDTQAAGSHYAKRWEKLQSLAREAQGQGSLTKSGPRAFLRETADVPRIAADVLREADTLNTIAADLDQQFMRDEQYLRQHKLPEVLFERHTKAWQEFRQKRDQMGDAMARLAQAQRLSNLDSQKEALGGVAKLLATMPSAKSFIPMKADAIRREGEKRSARAPIASTQQMRQAVEGAQKSLAKAAPAAPVAADLAETDDVVFTPKIREMVASFGGSPVEILNWVRNNIDFVPTYGSVQGAELTRINKRGNAADTASLTIALLRAADIPARYVYGLVEMPIAKAQNWLGGNIAPSQVMELMSKAGIPTQAVITGGQVSAVRFEHTWVEAYVDFNPGRGGATGPATTWVPMDASFKAYDIHPPIKLTAGAPFDAAAVLGQVNASAVHGQYGSVTGFDLSKVSAAIDAWKPAAHTYANQVQPNTTLGDIRGSASIVATALPILPGTLPYKVLVKGNSYAALPEGLQHKLVIHYYASEADYAADSVSLTYSMPLSKVGISTIGVDYVPATPADVTAFAQLRQDNAASLAPYLLSVTPQVQIEGQAVASAPAVPMGTIQYWKADIADPQGIFPPAAAGNRTVAGSHTVFSVDGNGVSADMVQKRLDLIPDNVSYPTREGLQQAGMHFWMLRDHQDQIWASQFDGKVVRLPSVGGFSAPLQVDYAFGVARSGRFQGFRTDVKRNLYAAVNATQPQQVQMFTLMGNTGSLLESSVWEMLMGKQLATSASAATVLALANEQRVPVYVVDSANIAGVIPLLQLSPDAKEEIQNAVAAGKRVVVPEREVTIGSWSGAGYVIQDPQDGTGIYQIEGGFSGAEVALCIIKALLENCTFQKILAKHLRQFLAQLVDRALTQAALFAPAGTMFPAAIALSAQFMWFLAFQFAIIDMAEMIATGQAEELLRNILACSIPSKCGLGGMGKNPVFFGTGEKMRWEPDYVGGGDDPLVLLRTYLGFAQDSGDSHIGQKWRHSYERSIYVPPPTTGADSTGTQVGSYSITYDIGLRAPRQVATQLPPPEAVLALRGDGGYIQYNYRTGQYLTSRTDVPAFLTRQVDGAGQTSGWTYLNERDETEHYNAAGKLQSITNRKGMTTTLSYDPLGQLVEVRNEFGRTLTFTYNGDGNVDTITDPASGVWRYAYDSYGNLTTVTGADNKVRQYHYEVTPSRGYLTGITDENNHRYATYKYDYQGRVIEEIMAGGADHTLISYEGDGRTKVTDALGTTRTYEFGTFFEDKRLLKVTEPCTSGCANGGVAEVHYDANGYISSETDFNNNVTAYSRNDRGLDTSRTEAQGSTVARTIATEYDNQWRVAKKLTEPTGAGSRVTNFTLDPRGNVRVKSVTVAGETRTWNYDYNAVGQMISEDGPRTDVADTSAWTYVGGNLDTMTDAAGNVTRYGNYDAHGRPRTVTDANGLVTTMTYDARGRLKTSSAAGELTAYDYDGVGNLSKLTLPDGTFLSYGYDDAQRLTSITDSLGNSVTYTLDDAGNRKKEDTRDPAGALAQTMTRVFDELSRAKEMRGAASQLTAYAYDKQGNLKNATDPLSHVTSNDYDALNRLFKVTEPQLAGAPAAGVITYAYDEQDNLKSVTDQRNLTTLYGYSGFDELKTLTSPDTGVTTYTYDAAGNVKTMQDARGQGATYTYDPLNRLKTLLYSDESLAFTYDDVTVSANSKGRLSRVNDGSGSTTYAYDPQGRVTSKTQLTGSVSRQVGYGYNAQGQLQTLTTPSGQSIGYAYANNQVTSITVNGQPLLGSAKYFPFGEVQKWTWGNGQAYERVYDLDGRIQSVTLGGQVRTYGFDDASRITGLTDRQGAATLASATVGYDNLDRLTSALNAASGGYNQTFVYDLIGNRTSQVVDGALTSLTYGSTSNRLTQIGSQTIGYDGAGNTTSDGIFTFVYSGRNRLTQVKQGGSTLASYQHNAFGERMVKTLGGANTVFVYDEDGHLLGEYTAAGALIQETVWLEDTPVATLRPKAGGGIDVRYVWADHLDTPRVVTTGDAAATVLWSWYSDPFGTTLASGSLEYNLRFPGQYFDAETGTHYNYFRDYDPGLGRYRQSDPIGLFGGGYDPYTYVLASPLQIRDSKGDRFGAGAIGKGRGLEQDFGQYLSKQVPCGCTARRNVYFNVPGQGRRFLDWVIFDQKNNPIEGFECKAGGSRYHTSQRTKDNWISRTFGFPIRLVRR